ncbi:MAG: hypothetical protein JSS94_08895 [Bacteroidetes bacterium]|nr:hypothetical protein [Bacteroidota bacterium]
MKTIYKVFLVLFIVFLGVNLYVIDWELGFMNEENSSVHVSLVASVIGLLFVWVMHTWSKLAENK